MWKKNVKRNAFTHAFFGLVSVGILPFFTPLNASSAIPEQPIKVVEVVQVVREPIEETVRLIGTIRSSNTSQVIARTSGPFKWIAQPGDLVTAGTLYAQIDDEEIKKNYELAVSKEKISRGQYERAKTLLTPGALSQNAVEEQEHALLASQIALATAASNLDKTQFIASFNGVIGVYYFRDGAHISIGDQVVSLYDPDSLYLELYIPASAMEWVADKQKIILRANDKDEILSLGHVQRMLDDQNYMCPGSVDLPKGDYLIGSTLSVDLVLRNNASAIAVPSSAIFLRDGKKCIYTVKNNIISLAPVITGLEQKGRVEILEGLQEDEFFVVRGQTRLHPGLKVQVVMDNPSNNVGLSQ